MPEFHKHGAETGPLPFERFNSGEFKISRGQGT